MGRPSYRDVIRNAQKSAEILEPSLVLRPTFRDFTQLSSYAVWITAS
jgi:hypothetical protein